MTPIRMLRTALAAASAMMLLAGTAQGGRRHGRRFGKDNLLTRRQG